MFTFSITAFNMRNLKQAEINSTQKRQRDHTIILIAHFHPNRSFPELTLLHHASVAFLTFTISDRRKKLKTSTKYYIKIDLSALGRVAIRFSQSESQSLSRASQFVFFEFQHSSIIIKLF